MIGDFNADLQTRNGEYLQNFADANYFSLLIDQATRITETSATILDQCITNAPMHIRRSEVLQPVSHNDHCTVAVFCNLPAMKQQAYPRTMWQYQHGNFDGFRQALIEFNWDAVFSTHSLDDCCNQWTETILDMAKEYIPNKRDIVRPSDKPWYNGHLRKMKRQLNRIFNHAKKTKIREDWIAFKILRSQYQAEVKRLRDEYDTNQYKYLCEKGTNNPKKWWTILKNSLKNSDLLETIPPITHGDEIVTNILQKTQLM